uniref:HECT domain-containing protein n=1 Tax=Spongospora subterranea TaxID=70186 RepID=A0A0H5QZI9_9EUKA|eukprot:CRZ07320.1 hypothetical protein [Spongospora subterranea]
MGNGSSGYDRGRADAVRSSNVDICNIDLARILDPSYVAGILKIHPDGLKSPDLLKDFEDDCESPEATVLEEMMLAIGGPGISNRQQDIENVVSTLLKQVDWTTVSEDAEESKYREILLRRIGQALNKRPNQESKPLPVKSALNASVQNITLSATSLTYADAASGNLTVKTSNQILSLPFEALIGVKLFCATLDIVGVSNESFSIVILDALLPLLSQMPPVTKTSCSDDEIGVLDSISRFLTSMLSSSTVLSDSYKSVAVSVLTGLAIARASLSDLLVVLEILLCGFKTLSATQSTKASSTSLSLRVVPFLQQLAKASGPMSSSSCALLSSSFDQNNGQHPLIPPGDLYSWGRGENGRLGISSVVKKPTPTLVSTFALKNLRDFATFANHALAFDAVGKAYSWGKGDNGRLGHGNTSHQSVPKAIEKILGVYILSVACGLSHSLLLSADGVVFSMGDGNNGRLGHKSSTGLTEPHPIQQLQGIKVAYIACGAYHSIAIDGNETGTVYSWGKNDSGQLGLGHRNDCSSPTVIEALSSKPIKMIACGWEHNLAITVQGEALSWGSGYEASRPVLGHGGCTPETIPRTLDALHDKTLVFVAAGWDHALAITESGELYTWGEGLSGKLGHGDSANQELPRQVEALALQQIVWVDGGADHSAAISATGQVWTWGGGSEFQLGHGSESYSNVPINVNALSGTSIRSIRVGDKYSMAITGAPVDPVLLGTGGRPLATKPIETVEADPQSSTAEDVANDEDTVGNPQNFQAFSKSLVTLDADVLLDPLTVAVILLEHLQRLAEQQVFDRSIVRPEEISSAPFCIDVQPASFISLMNVSQYAFDQLCDLSNPSINLHILKKTLELLGCNLRRLVMLSSNQIAELGFAVAKEVVSDHSQFSLCDLHKFLVKLIERPIPTFDDEKETAVTIGGISDQIVEILQIGLELFYPTREAKFALANDCIIGDSKVTKKIGQSMLSRLSESSIAAQLIPKQDDRREVRSLLEFLRLLINRCSQNGISGTLPLLRFLSSLQTHLLSQCTFLLSSGSSDDSPFTVMTLDYARSVLDAAVASCQSFQNLAPSSFADSVKILRQSIVSNISPSLIQTLSLSGLASRVLPSLLALLHSLDKIAVGLDSGGLTSNSSLEDSDVNASDQWLFSTVHIVTDAVCDVLQAQIRADCQNGTSSERLPTDQLSDSEVSYTRIPNGCADVISSITDQSSARVWLSSKLFQFGFEHHSGAPGLQVDSEPVLGPVCVKPTHDTPRAIRAPFIPAAERVSKLNQFVVSHADCKELYDEIVEELGLGGRLWAWLNIAMRAERVGAPQLWLDRAARCTFACLLHHQDLGAEAVVLGRLITIKNVGRGGPDRRPRGSSFAYLRVPFEIAEVWRESQAIRTHIMFKRTSAMSEFDGDSSSEVNLSYEAVVAPIIAKASLLLCLATGRDSDEYVEWAELSNNGNDGDGGVGAKVFDWERSDLSNEIVDIPRAFEEFDDDEAVCAGTSVESHVRAYDKNILVNCDKRQHSKNGDILHLSSWKHVRLLLISVSKWKRAVNSTLQHSMKQKLSKESPYADFRRFFQAGNISASVIRQLLLQQHDRAVERWKGLRHLRRLLAMLQLRSVRAKLLSCMPKSLSHGSALEGLDGCGSLFSGHVQRQALSIMRCAVQGMQQVIEEDQANATCSAELLLLGKASLAAVAQRLHPWDHELFWKSGAIPSIQSFFGRDGTTVSRALKPIAWKVFRLISVQLALSRDTVNLHSGDIYRSVHAELIRCIADKHVQHSGRRLSTSSHSGGGIGGWTPADCQVLLSSPVVIHAGHLGYRLPVLPSQSRSSNDYTIAFWIRLNSSTTPGGLLSTAEQIICIRLGSAQVFSPKITLSKYDKKVHVSVTTSTGNEVIISSNGLTPYVWTHVSIYVSKRNASLVLAVSPENIVTVHKTFQGSVRSLTLQKSPFFIGKALEGNDTAGFDGHVAQVIFLRRALEDSEIANILKEGRPSQGSAESTSCQLLSLLWAMGSGVFLRKDGDGDSPNWIDLLLALLASGTLGVRIRVLRLLRHFLPQLSPYSICCLKSHFITENAMQASSHVAACEDRIEPSPSPRDGSPDQIFPVDYQQSSQTSSLVTFLLECSAASLWTWSVYPQDNRTEHHRMAVADESIMLLRFIVEGGGSFASNVISQLTNALDDIPGLLRELQSNSGDSSTFPLKGKKLGYAITALAVVGGHKRMLRLGARVRLPNCDIGTVCWFRSRSQIMRVILDNLPNKPPITIPVKLANLFDEGTSSKSSQLFQDKLLSLFALVLAEYRKDITMQHSLSALETEEEQVNGNSVQLLEKLVVRTHISSMLLKAVCSMISTDNQRITDGDLLSQLMFVASMPSKTESRLDRASLEFRHQFLWAQLRQSRHAYFNTDKSPIIQVPSSAPPSVPTSPVAAAPVGEEQVFQETKIDHVAAMGFDRDFCRLALANCAWDEASAVEFLLVNLDMLEAQKRATESAIAAAVGHSVPSNASSSPKDTSANRSLRQVIPEPVQAAISHGLPTVDISLIGDTSSREIGTDVYVERFFADNDRGVLPCVIESYLISHTVPGDGDQASTGAIGLDDASLESGGYIDTLHLVKEMDDTLGIVFAREAVLAILFSPGSTDASITVRSCALKDPFLLIRLLKLVLFRNRMPLDREKALLTNISSVFHQRCSSEELTAFTRFQSIILEECLRHMESAALPENCSIIWGNRDFVCTDFDALCKPRVELASWMFEFLISLPHLSPGSRVLVVERLCRTLKSSSLTLREAVFDILSKLLYSLDAGDAKDFEEFAPRYISLIKATGIERMAEQRLVVEEDRLIKSRLLSSMLCLIAAVDALQRQLKSRQASSEQSKASLSQPPAPIPDEITSDAIEVYWEIVSSAESSQPSEYSLEMRKLPGPSDPSQTVPDFVQVYRGAARAFRAVGLSPLRSYELRVIGLLGNIRSLPSPAVTILTYPLLYWDPHNARASGRARVRLSNCNLTASFDAGSDKWRSLQTSKGFCSGLHKWEIVLDRMSKGYIFLGVSTASANPDTYVGGDAHGFGLFISDRSRYHGRNKIKGGAKYGDQMNVNDVVGIILDLDKRSMSYTLNGKDLGVAFDEIPTDHCLYPSVSFYHRGDQISFSSAASAQLTNTFLHTARDRMVRLSRRIGTATELIRTLIYPSSGTFFIPHHFMDLAYAYWRSWCANDFRTLQTSSGEIITIDVCRASCARLGFIPNTRVSLPSGAMGRLMGICANSNRAVVMGDSDIDPDLFDFEQIKSTTVSPAPMPDVSRAEGSLWTLSEFVAGACSIGQSFDGLLVRICNDLSDRLGYDPLALLYDEVAEGISHAHELQDFPAVNVCARFALFRTLNLYISHVLPYLSITTMASSALNLGRLIRQIRHLLLVRVKTTLLTDILHHTSTYTKPSEDPYEDPPDLKQVSLNRHLAAKAFSSKSVDSCLTQSLFGQAQTQLDVMHVRDLRRGFVRMLDDGQERTFKVKFVGEGVTDNGGPYRECFNEFVAELFRFDCALPLFIPTPNAREAQGSHRDRAVPSPSCTRFDLYRFFGKLIGVAVRNKIHLNLPLPMLFWSALVGQPPCRRHLLEIDSHLYQLITQVEKATPDDFSDQFDHTFECLLSDNRSTVELMPGGSQTALSYRNRSEWIRLMEHKRLHESDAQIEEIRNGFASIVPLTAFELFTAEEMETLVCGHADFNVELLQSMTVYESGLSADDPHIQYFWQVLHEMTADEKSDFAKFVWARTRLPVRADQFITKFKIQPAAQFTGHADHQLPQSHTCFFSIALPPYSSTVVLRHKLLYAARNCQTLDRDLKLSDAEIAELGDI